MATVEGDFYEDDEPLGKILAIWERAPKTLTVSSPSSEEPSSLVVLDQEVYTTSQADVCWASSRRRSGAGSTATPEPASATNLHAADDSAGRVLAWAEPSGSG